MCFYSWRHLFCCGFITWRRLFALDCSRLRRRDGRTNVRLRRFVRAEPVLDGTEASLIVQRAARTRRSRGSRAGRGSFEDSCAHGELPAHCACAGKKKARAKQERNEGAKWGQRLPGSVPRKRAAPAGSGPAPNPSSTVRTRAGRTKTRRTSTHARGRRLLRRPRSRRPSRRRRRPTSSSRRAGAATLSSPSAARGVSPTSRTPSRRWQWLRDGDATIRERAARPAPAFVE